MELPKHFPCPSAPEVEQKWETSFTYWPFHLLHPITLQENHGKATRHVDHLRGNPWVFQFSRWSNRMASRSAKAAVLQTLRQRLRWRAAHVFFSFEDLWIQMTRFKSMDPPISFPKAIGKTSRQQKIGQTTANSPWERQLLNGMKIKLARTQESRERRRPWSWMELYGNIWNSTILPPVIIHWLGLGFPLSIAQLKPAITLECEKYIAARRWMCHT